MKLPGSPAALPPGDAPAELTKFRLLLVALAIFGIALSAYVFFLPYDTVADEEEYLTEIFSAARGHPSGWGIRHLLYPLIISPFVALASTAGTPPESLALVARLVNWSMWWLSLYAAFRIADRIFGREAAWLAVVFIAFNWAWMLASKRLMMDVPSTTWLLLALYFRIVPQRPEGLQPLLAGLTCAALAAATKFQMGPLAVIYGLWLFFERARARQTWQILIATAFSLFLVGGIGMVDYLTYGRWFSSILEFRQYNLVNAQDFAIKYGACEEPLYYLKHAKDIFSLFLIPLALPGLILCLGARRRHGGLLASLVVAYFVILHLVCHKQARYLVSILPEVSILGAGGLALALNCINTLARPVMRHSLIALVIGGVALTIVSLTPRNELKTIFGQQETCADFVYRTINELPKGSKVALATPCGAPTTYLKDYEIHFGDLGFNSYTRKAEIEKFAGLIESVDAVFVDPHNSLGETVRAAWSRQGYATTPSPLGNYVLYRRLGLSQPAQ
ncbi:glycosyltransferase family 39 protein [Zoogloea sp.]|uniref:glycosyltransferase family 39 protein n=1 Tax=Zoogloea sp. TaxID=49181 RepID=UPI0035B3EC70